MNHLFVCKPEEYVDIPLNISHQPHLYQMALIGFYLKTNDSKLNWSERLHTTFIKCYCDILPEQWDNGVMNPILSTIPIVRVVNSKHFATAQHITAPIYMPLDAGKVSSNKMKFWLQIGKKKKDSKVLLPTKVNLVVSLVKKLE